MSDLRSRSVVLALAISLPFASSALAAPGLDGDPPPIPGMASYDQPLPRAHAARAPMEAFHPDVRAQGHPPHARGDRTGKTHASDPSAVYWRGRYVGSDPDPQVRLEMLRDAIGGGG
jgi:hypothetical protein